MTTATYYTNYITSALVRGQGRREDPIQRSSTAGVAVSLSRKAPAPGGEGGKSPGQKEARRN